MPRFGGFGGTGGNARAYTSTANNMYQDKFGVDADEWQRQHQHNRINSNE